MQNGYDAQVRGDLDPGLMREDTAAGREYREGTRQARRDAFDAEQGLAPFRPAERTADFLEPETPPPVAIAAPEHREDAPSDAPALGGAFAEPQPAARKPKKQKAADATQGDLFT